MSYLLCIETGTPQYYHQQDQVSTFFANTTTNTTDKRRIKMIARKSGINGRYSVINDFSEQPGNFTFFAKNPALEPIPGIEKRMNLYRKEALKLSLDTVLKIKNFETIKTNITHIITVTCTGLYAPGLDIELAHALGLKETTKRSSVNFMGCNAAILAMKQADDICKSDAGALVLVVCTELCTIHFQKNYSPDYLLSNLLFGDGCAALIIGNDPDSGNFGNMAKICSFHSLMIHEGNKDMAWHISENGFIMNLTSYVSGLLNKNIEKLLQKSGINKQEIHHWAIHPGGKRILDDFCAAMELDKKKLAESYNVLSEFGNMSSVTILFVLKRMLQKKVPEDQKSLYCAAFGPGLSIESVMLSYV